MRISELPFLVGLTYAQRPGIVREPIDAQNVDLSALITDLFYDVQTTARDTVAPLVDYAENLRRQNQRSPASLPLLYWQNLEQQRTATDEILRGALALAASERASAAAIKGQRQSADSPSGIVARQTATLSAARIGSIPVAASAPGFASAASAASAYAAPNRVGVTGAVVNVLG